MASVADRHLDITFGLQVVESTSLVVSVHFREAFSYPYISFFHVLVNSFYVTSFRTLFEDPLPSLYWRAVSVGVGGEELKWHQLAYHQLMSQPRISF